MIAASRSTPLRTTTRCCRTKTLIQLSESWRSTLTSTLKQVGKKNPLCKISAVEMWQMSITTANAKVFKEQSKISTMEMSKLLCETSSPSMKCVRVRQKVK